MSSAIDGRLLALSGGPLARLALVQPVESRLLALIGRAFALVGVVLALVCF